MTDDPMILGHPSPPRIAVISVCPDRVSGTPAAETTFSAAVQVSLNVPHQTRGAVRAFDPRGRQLITRLRRGNRGRDRLPAPRARPFIDGVRHRYASSPIRARASGGRIFPDCQAIYVIVIYGAISGPTAVAETASVHAGGTCSEQPANPLGNVTLPRATTR
jgi:hypothetical protein